MEGVYDLCVEMCEALNAHIRTPRIRSPLIQETPGQPTDKIFDCDAATLELLSRQAAIACKQRGSWELLQSRCNDLISLANRKFYAYPFRDVPECWRRLHTDASILKACSLVLKSTWGSTDEDLKLKKEQLLIAAEDLDELVKTLDLAVIVAGAPGLARRDWINVIMRRLQRICEPALVDDVDELRPVKRRKLDDVQVDGDDIFPSTSIFLPPVTQPSRRIFPSPPDLFWWLEHDSTGYNPEIGPEPLIIHDGAVEWPAMTERPWKKPSYLMSETIGGRRMVPVEVGRSYVDEDWGQRIIPFREFLDNYILQKGITRDGKNDGEKDPAAPQTGYLAQHDLFTQLPSLREDISIPDFCFLDAPPPHKSSPLAAKHAATPQLEEPLLNAWFGPAGTISPMHTDPYHNILAQVVGSKYVRLYGPGETEKLYPRGIEEGGVDMENTSSVDVGILEGWDGSKREQEEAHSKYPLYKEAQFVDLILEEGEFLYIPLGWWHYVRSLSISFSVSFWWN